MVNAKAIESAMRIGLALNCSIAEWCRFARKNYFYPDMPKNYQISQYDEPIAFDGWTEVPLDGEVYRIGIERAHMEEDTGKSLHVGGATGRIHGADHSLLDYNRSGVPLIEIVTKPIEGTGAKAPEVARAYVTMLRDLLRALGVSDVRMEQGSLRCDANVSLRPSPDAPLGTRTETKNVNSLRSVERAVRYEITRQAAVLADGGTIKQETRHWQEDSGTTSPGRSKEQAEDYRYFPEPDLVPVAPSREWVEELRGTLPEPPAERLARITGEWGFSELEMRDVISAGAVNAIEATVAAGASPQSARKWWLTEVARRANETGVDLEAAGVTPAQVAEIQALVEARHHQRQAGPVGVRGRDGRRGRSPAGDRGPRAGRGVRRGRARRSGGRGDRGQPGRRRQDPGRQGAGRRRADRCGDEGDPRHVRPRPGPRAHPGAADLTICARTQVSMPQSPARGRKPPRAGVRAGLPGGQERDRLGRGRGRSAADRAEARRRA